jgi:hypothetical protein
MVHPGTITIIIDEPIPVAGSGAGSEAGTSAGPDAGTNAEGKNIELSLRDKVREAIEANLKAAGNYSESGEHAGASPSTKPAASSGATTMERTSVVSHG